MKPGHGRGAKAYLDEPHAPVSLVEHELLVGVGLRIVVLRGLCVERLFLIFNIHRGFKLTNVRVTRWRLEALRCPM